MRIRVFFSTAKKTEVKVVDREDFFVECQECKNEEIHYSIDEFSAMMSATCKCGANIQIEPA